MSAKERLDVLATGMKLTIVSICVAVAMLRRKGVGRVTVRRRVDWKVDGRKERESDIFRTKDGGAVLPSVSFACDCRGRDRIATCRNPTAQGGAPRVCDRLATIATGMLTHLVSAHPSIG